MYFLRYWCLSAALCTGLVLVTLGTMLIIFIDTPTTGEGTHVQILVLISLLSILGIGAILYTVYKPKVENYQIAYAICTGIFWRGGLDLHANHLLARQRLDYGSIIRGHSECVHPCHLRYDRYSRTAS